jgi:uncharacterized protein
MTTTVGTNGRALSSHTGKGPAVVPKGQLGAPTRRRRPGRWAFVAVAVAVVALAGLLNVSLVSAMSHRSSYLVMAHPVAAGQIVTAADLRTVDLAGAANLNALPASQRSSVVGRAATSTLGAGSLVPAGAVGTPSGLGIGQVLAALGLKTAQYPPSLREGDHVMIVGTGTGSSVGNTTASVDDAAGAALVADSRVMAVTPAAPSSGSDEVVVSVVVDSASAARVAGAASVGKVSLVLVGTGR